jgi:hypothetical protein
LEILHLSVLWERDGSVGILTRLQAERSGVQIPARGKDVSILVNGHTYSVNFLWNMCVTGALSLVSTCETDQSPASRAEIKKEWSHTSIPYVFKARCLTGNSTLRSESRCAFRLRHVDLVVSIEVAVEVCCCFTVFSC